MKAPPPVVLVPRPSRRALALIAATHLPTAALILGLPLPSATALAGAAAIALLGAAAAFRTTGRGRPQALRLGIDRRLTCVARDGGETRGTIVADSYVGPHVTTIVWRPEGAWR